MNSFKRISFWGVLFFTSIVSSIVLFTFDNKTNSSDILLFMSMIFGLLVCKKIEKSKTSVDVLFDDLVFWFIAITITTTIIILIGTIII